MRSCPASRSTRRAWWRSPGMTGAGLQPGQSGWNVRIRASRDGGESWQASVPVADVPTLEDKKARDRLPGVGHTAGLVADADGLFHCLWVDGRGGVLQAYTAPVTVEP